MFIIFLLKRKHLLGFHAQYQLISQRYLLIKNSSFWAKENVLENVGSWVGNKKKRKRIAVEKMQDTHEQTIYLVIS